MTTGTVSITYRVEILSLHEEWTTAIGGIETHEQAEQTYEVYRNRYPGRRYRLIMIHEHCERDGQGRVFD